MKSRLAIGTALAATWFLAQPASAQTNVLANGSFESGLTGWTSATQLGPGAAGTCSYNAATAPGTETITSVAGFPAAAGTKIALGSVFSTSDTGALVTCVLYQDVAIPAGATVATFTYDIGVKDGNDGGNHTAVQVGIYSTSSVPAFEGVPVVGNAPIYDPALADTTLQAGSSTVNFNVSSVAGTTVRFAIMNAADFLGGEVIGIDNVQFLVTSPSVTPAPPAWALGALGLIACGAGLLWMRRRPA